MVTDSPASPNTKAAPKPDNWHGVTAGIALSRRYMNEEQYAEAEAELRKILELAPRERDAWQLLGDALMRQEKNADAQACFEKHLELEQNKASSERYPLSLRLAKILWAQQEYKTARSMLAVLILRDPDNSVLLDLKDAWIQQLQAQEQE